MIDIFGGGVQLSPPPETPPAPPRWPRKSMGWFDGFFPRGKWRFSPWKMEIFPVENLLLFGFERRSSMKKRVS